MCSAIPAILPDGDKCWRGAFCTMAMWAVNKSDHDNKDVNKEVNKYVTKDINEYDNEDDKKDVNGDKKEFVNKDEKRGGKEEDEVALPSLPSLLQLFC